MMNGKSVDDCLTIADDARDDPNRPFPAVQTALWNGFQVDALCLDCDHISRPDLAGLSREGCGHVRLIWLPFGVPTVRGNVGLS